MFLSMLRCVGLVAFALATWPTDTHALPCTAGAILPPANLTVSTACEGAFGGNDTEAAIAATDPFGIENWILSDKSDDDVAGSPINITVIPDADGTSGTWSVSSWLGYTNAMITLMAGGEWAAFLIDTDFTSGVWSTDNLFENNRGTPLELGHLSVWVTPLPPALLLFASGLAGLGFLARMRCKRKPASLAATTG